MLTVQRKAKIIGFNYDSLAPADAKVAKIAAKRIRGKMTGNVISIGEDLRSVKGKLSHGHFGAWLRAEFGMTQRTAQRYMAAARLADDCDEVAHLSPSALHALSAPTTPKSARAKIIGRLQAGETLEAREVTAVIRTEIATKQPTTRTPNKPAKSGTNATDDPKVAFGERTREL